MCFTFTTIIVEGKLFRPGKAKETGSGREMSEPKHRQKAARLLSSKYGGSNDSVAVFKMSAFQGELSKSAELCLNFSC